MSFDNMALCSPIQKAIKICGYTKPTPIQEKAIPIVLSGQDLTACAQTGTGKTAAFVLPALNYLNEQKRSKKPRVLVLSPTRELADQICKSASDYGRFLKFNIVSLVGGVPYKRQIDNLRRGADMIVATPGRLMDHMRNGLVDLSQVDIFVLDEADRMLDMGFIEDIQEIASATPKKRQTLLFSATLDKRLNSIIKDLLDKPSHIDLSQKQLDAPNIKQSLYRAKNMKHKARMLRHFLNDENIYKAIIFSATKALSDQLANELRSDGFAAGALHGDLKQNVRNRTIDKLRKGKIQFLVATDVAARGIDIDDITHVINFDLPRFSEDYVHRVGRTGRAGREGQAISFCTDRDFKIVRNIERYLGKKLQVLKDDDFDYRSPINKRSDADKYNPEAIFERDHYEGGNRRGGRNAGRRANDSKFSKPSRRRSFDDGDGKPSRGRNKSFDDRDDRAPRGRRSFDDRDDRPSRGRKSFDDKDDRPSRGRKSFDDKDDRPSRSRRSFDDKDDRPSRGRKKSFKDRDEKPSRGFKSKSIEDRGRDKPSKRRKARGPFEDKVSVPSKRSGRKPFADGEFNIYEKPKYNFAEGETISFRNKKKKPGKKRTVKNDVRKKKKVRKARD